MVLSSLNMMIFILISLLHVYWALGGKWGIDAVIPELDNGTVAFRPPVFATLVVAVGLLGFALIHANAIGLVFLIDTYYVRIGLGVIGGIFALRAIGDFNYVGWFKKKRTGAFAENDTRYYVPLCVLLSLNAWMTYFLL